MASPAHFRNHGRFAKKSKVENSIKSLTAIAEARKRKRENNEISTSCAISGFRIVDLIELGRNLKCVACKAYLSLENIDSEKLLGLHSVLVVKCHLCGILTTVATGLTDGRFAHINKSIVLDIPGLSPVTYKRYERIVGLAIEDTARESCLRAAQEERSLTIKNITKIRSELPKEIADELYPEWNLVVETLIIVTNAFKDGIIGEQLFKILCSLIIGILKIIISYDMGWSKRGNGCSYNSMDGYATMIGYCTQKILDYTTRNRKCKACAMGVSREHHDCRHNFTGSAKAMEADAEVELILESEILQSVALEVGVVIGDEDSATMASIHNAAPDRRIFKLADKNHLIKNFGKELYELAKIHNELGRKGVINHIKKCFSYAVAQNKGKTKELATTLRSISDHLFDKHESCAKWCKPTVNHSVKLCDSKLHEDLSSNFERLAENAQKFAVSASSQSNESVNNIIAHKAHKNKCLSLSEACDYRVASAVCVKNDGDMSILVVKKKLNLLPGKYTAQFFSRLDMIRSQRAQKSQLVSTKQQRLKLKAAKELLRKTNEDREGLTYQSNCGMRSETVVKCPAQGKKRRLIGECPDKKDSEDCDSKLIERLVYFDLELGDLNPDAALLQIAVKSTDREFSVYIEPSKVISPAASKVNGLRCISGNLYFHDKIVPTLSLSDALERFHEFLNKNSVLVAHNAPFDVPRLLRALTKCDMEARFNKSFSFSDSLSILRKKLPDRKGPGLLKLARLAKDFLDDDVDEEKFHDALYDVTILEKIAKSLGIEETLVEKSTTFEACIEKYRNNQEANSNLQYLDALKTVLHRDTLKKIASKKITFDSLKLLYAQKRKETLEQFLSEPDQNNRPRDTKDRRVISKIICCIEKHL
ncbi:hypothetical protein QAD02_010063 [Eretmocerus hayati]|uniref:Uncharacterized protein n=1 Tax=Eretmocerus hayati TaxID=131215 RepID=A0ACC2NFP3_9HYME|nr:hypothetical protein QAD02_010063 [Eretmocerus hayati]